MVLVIKEINTANNTINAEYKVKATKVQLKVTKNTDTSTFDLKFDSKGKLIEDELKIDERKKLLNLLNDSYDYRLKQIFQMRETLQKTLPKEIELSNKKAYLYLLTDGSAKREILELPKLVLKPILKITKYEQKDGVWNVEAEYEDKAADKLRADYPAIDIDKKIIAEVEKLIKRKPTDPFFNKINIGDLNLQVHILEVIKSISEKSITYFYGTKIV